MWQLPLGPPHLDTSSDSTDRKRVSGLGLLPLSPPGASSDEHASVPRVPRVRRSPRGRARGSECRSSRGLCRAPRRRASCVSSAPRRTGRGPSARPPPEGDVVVAACIGGAGFGELASELRPRRRGRGPYERADAEHRRDHEQPPPPQGRAAEDVRRAPVPGGREGAHPAQGRSSVAARARPDLLRLGQGDAEPEAEAARRADEEVSQDARGRERPRLARGPRSLDSACSPG